jgi:hypothetical protein
MLIKEIFNESIWADLNKGTTIGSTSLRNRHSVQQIRDHLEFKFNKHRPVDIQTMMNKFGMEVDTAQPLEKFFERQQQCQQLLTETSEPIRDASMKRTAIGHFQESLISYAGYANTKALIQPAPVHGRSYARISLISKWSTLMTKLH